MIIILPWTPNIDATIAMKTNPFMAVYLRSQLFTVHFTRFHSNLRWFPRGRQLLYFAYIFLKILRQILIGAELLSAAAATAQQDVAVFSSILYCQMIARESELCIPDFMKDFIIIFMTVTSFSYRLVRRSYTDV